MSKNLRMMDETYIQRTLFLARLGLGLTRPNPMVGAVLVQGSRIVGEGYHHYAGGPHAEIHALRKAGTRARGATLYTNLEPCCHLEKRTPPCTDAIIQNKIQRVVVGMRDPNPSVNGKGLSILRRFGITVVEGILKNEALRLNEVYAKMITTGIPFVISKAAVSLDGKISSIRGSAGRITGEKAIMEAHRLRSRYDAVMVGISTILIDNPRLTVRLPGFRNRDPHRVILDTRLRIPFSARVLTLRSNALTIIATTNRAPLKKIQKLERQGATVCVIKSQNGRILLPNLLEILGRMRIGSLLIEGGGEVNRSAWDSGIVDKLIWFLSPKFIGDKGVGVFGESGRRTTRTVMRYPIPIRDFSVQAIGRDFVMEGYP